jgi:hypothetical protein
MPKDNKLADAVQAGLDLLFEQRASSSVSSDLFKSHIQALANAHAALFADALADRLVLERAGVVARREAAAAQRLRARRRALGGPVPPAPNPAPAPADSFLSPIDDLAGMGLLSRKDQEFFSFAATQLGFAMPQITALGEREALAIQVGLAVDAGAPKAPSSPAPSLRRV